MKNYCFLYFFYSLCRLIGNIWMVKTNDDMVVAADSNVEAVVVAAESGAVAVAVAVVVVEEDFLESNQRHHNQQELNRMTCIPVVISVVACLEDNSSYHLCPAT